MAAYASHPRATDADDVLRRHWPTLCRMLPRMARDHAEDGLIRSQPGRRLFLDWSPMSRAEPNLTYNLRYVHALNLAATLAKRIAVPEADAWVAEAAALAARLRETHLSSQGWRESPGGDPACQLALALLILTGCVSDDAAAPLADAIIARSLDLDDTASPGKADPGQSVHAPLPLSGPRPPWPPCRHPRHHRCPLGPLGQGGRSHDLGKLVHRFRRRLCLPWLFGTSPGLAGANLSAVALRQTRPLRGSIWKGANP